MRANILRVIVLASSCAAGGLLFSLLGKLLEPSAVNATPWIRSFFPIGLCTVGVLSGFLLGRRLISDASRLGTRIQSLSTQEAMFGGVGAIIGSLIAVMVMNPLQGVLHAYFLPLYLLAILFGAIAFFEVVLAAQNELLNLFSGRAVAPEPPSELEKMRGGKILDTNVIIDGRVLDVARAGFLQGSVYIPGFVLDELQYIADSSDSLKRARGRRGLDILTQMRKELNVITRDMDHLAGDGPVDQKLVALAKRLEADVVTNDYNLNKVAEIQGIMVLNVNQLANALKPVVMAGEEMTVSIIKEGKEMNQGIAYLDDGTMIVVENARRVVGDTVDVVVTSVLQTVAGKMIFATLRMEHDREEELLGRNIRSYSSSGPRRKTRPQ